MTDGEVKFSTRFGTTVAVSIGDEWSVDVSLTEGNSMATRPVDSTNLTPQEARLLAGVLTAYADEAEN